MSEERLQEIKEELAKISFSNIGHCINTNLILDYITNLQEEIERLNNIINELEKYLIEEIENYEKQIKYYKNNKDLRSGILDLVGEYEGEKVCFEDMLGRLQELKGSDKE